MLAVPAGCRDRLRLSELGSLTSGSIDLKGKPPTVTVKAAYAKSRREDTLPLRPPTATMLARWLTQSGGGGSDAPIFRLPHRANVSGMLQADLAAGREAWIAQAADPADRKRRQQSEFLVYCNEAGRYADFHALRHTFVTRLARSGVEPKTAQDLARHKSIDLTMSVYSHTVLRDRAAALDGLPELSAAEPEQKHNIG